MSKETTIVVLNEGSVLNYKQELILAASKFDNFEYCKIPKEGLNKKSMIDKSIKINKYDNIIFVATPPILLSLAVMGLSEVFIFTDNNECELYDTLTGKYTSLRDLRHIEMVDDISNVDFDEVDMDDVIMQAEFLKEIGIYYMSSVFLTAISKKMEQVFCVGGYLEDMKNFQKSFNRIEHEAEQEIFETKMFIDRFAEAGMSSAYFISKIIKTVLV